MVVCCVSTAVTLFRSIDNGGMYVDCHKAASDVRDEFVFFIKQKTAYEMRISDWSSDVDSSDLRFAGFAVLKAPYVPSVLVELGFLSNPVDRKNLHSPAFRDRIAEGLARSVDNYFQGMQSAFR